MSHSSYKDGEVVWVKWGNVWWPGEVWSDSRVPEDIITSLRKPVIAFVKFFQEDSFEFVRSQNNICQYNSDKKMDFIKRGMDKYRSSNKIMTNFPADVIKAEQLTNGNVNILNSLETPTKSRASSTVTNTEPAKKSTNTLTSTTPSPVATSKKSVGSYNSSVKVQNTTTPSPKSNDKKLTCTMCNFATDRMNLLMMHIKNHSLTILSRVNSSLDVRSRPIVPKTTRNKELDDGIAEDVRKIKESMKETATPTTSAKKTRTPAAVTATTAAKSTPKLKQSRQTRKDKKLDKDVKNEEVKSKKKEQEDEDKPKSTNACELKNELLADWLDEEDNKMDETKESESLKTPVEKPIESPIKSIEKGTEVSRSIRNIPKKQRVSEIYIQPEPEKVELSNSVKIDAEPVTLTAPPQQEDVKEDTSNVISPPVESTRKTPKASKRKHASDSSNEPEKKKMSEDKDDEKILMATAELLNETEVPKISNVQSPSTFHTNDIDKRYLPPKERNKRIFRAKNSPETVAKAIPTPIPKTDIADKSIDDKERISTEYDLKVDDSIAAAVNNDDIQQLPPIVSSKSDRQELILPHKKKQSSRLLTAENVSPASESPKTTTTVIEAIKQDEQIVTPANHRANKKNRKSNDAIEVEKIKATQSPLREIVDVTKNESVAKSPSTAATVVCFPCDSTTSSVAVSENRCQKRQHSRDSQSDKDVYEFQPESKKFHKQQPPVEKPKTIIACSSEAICITSKGSLSVARRDSIKTTTANSVVVTSQVIISEATKQPVAATNYLSSAHDMISSSSGPKQSISSATLSTQQQTLTNALKFPKEKVENLKKQGLVTIENNKTKLTPKGRQKFKEFQNELLSTTSSATNSTISQRTDDEVVKECDSIDAAVVERTTLESVLSEEAQKSNEIEKDGSKEEEEKEKVVDDKNGNLEVIEEPTDEIKKATDVDSDSQNDVTITADEKFGKSSTKEIESDSSKTNDSCELDESKSQSTAIKSVTIVEDESMAVVENGKNEDTNDVSKDDDEKESDLSQDDANSGSTGLIALQAETFGGPANCFYLCRQVEDRYEPVDNQILVLNAQNALVPYEGVISDLGLASAENSQENLAAYSQLSPNSNIIINTPNGQKIELNHMTILALQEQTDENGIASIELAGEQLELNINAILEAIAAQQDVAETNESLISGAVLLDSSDVPLIIDSELPLDVHHPSVATQVSETLTKPIMSTTVAPEIAINPLKPAIAENVTRMLNIEDSLATIGVTTQRADIPKSLELPITVTNPKIVETVNHRKLIASLGADIVPESFVVQQSTDNGSDD